MRALALLFSGDADRQAGWSLPISRWLQVAAERRALARLDDRALRDIGIDRATAITEAERPFWDVSPTQR